MKVNRTTGVVMLAVGAVAVLGFGGTALADSSGASRTHTVAATESPSAVTTSTDDTRQDDDSTGIVESPAADVSSSSSPEARASADDSASPRPSSSAATGSPRAEISAEQAKAIAIRAAGGGTVESIEREREHGRLVWEIDVNVKNVEHDIDVDAVTGAVNRHKIDRDDDRDDRDDDRGRDDDHDDDRYDD